MRVYIGACGIGLGHAGQMLCVAQELKGVEILFSSYGRAVQYIRGEGYGVVQSPKIGWRESDGLPDATATLLLAGPLLLQSARQIWAEIAAMKEFRADVVLSDARYSTILAARKLRIPFALVTHQISFELPRMPFRALWEGGTTMLNTIYLSDKRILVPDLPPPHTIAAGSLRFKTPLPLEYVGFVMRPLPHDLPSPEEAKESLGFDAQPLVYAALRGDADRIAAPILEGLKRSGCNALVVLGKHGESISRMDEKIRIANWIEERALALRAADLVIVRGGHRTLSEVAMHGKPALVVPMASQPEQRINARGFAAIGCGKVIEEGEISAAVVERAVRAMLTNDRWSAAAEALGSLAAQFDGARRIADIARALGNSQPDAFS
ncbi:MAG: glycosyltransferase family protein [Candidatus Thermoplasmatota archaeon]